jgi:WD40 repeat protein
MRRVWLLGLLSVSWLPTALSDQAHSPVLWLPAAGHDVALSRDWPRLDHPEDLFTITFSPNGKLVATAGNGPIRVWDGRTGRELRQIAAAPDYIAEIVFSPDGRVIASLSRNHDRDKVQFWDAATGRELRALAIDKAGGTGVAFSPDGSLVAARSRTGQVYVYEVATGKLRWQSKNDIGGAIGFVAFSVDGKLLACGTDGAKMHWWEPESGKEVARPPDRSASCGSFSPDGSSLALGDHSYGAIGVWDLKQEKWRLTSQGHDQGIQGIGLSPDSRMLVSTGRDVTWRVGNSTRIHYTVRVWEAATMAEVFSIRAGTNGFYAAKLSPDSKTLAVGTGKAAVLVPLADVFTKGDPAKLTNQDLAGFWGDFAESDGWVAMQAVWTMAAAPETSVWLTEKVKMMKLDNGLLTEKERRRMRRAVQTLELVGSSHAKQLLAQIARQIGDPDVLRDVQASLDRLAKVKQAP